MITGAQAPLGQQSDREPVWVTGGSRFLEQLDPKDREKLLRLGNVRRFRKGSLIFKAGVEGHKVYVLKSGRVKVARVSETGRDMILWFCLPGEMFGLAAMPRIGPRIVYAQACTDTTVQCIPTNDFLSLLRGNPRVSVELIHLLLCRLYILCDGLLNATTGSAESRLHRLLSHLGYRYGRPVGEELRLDIPLTQQEIADMIGASRQTVSSLLAEMKQRGEIRMVKRRLFLPLEP